jgi:predicted pyridoxine 5'-phosphate oxidase superfamily flavin-nucleotide-binding protein
MHLGFYHAGSRGLQAEFGTTRLADRILDVHVTPTLGASERSFIERSDSFFLATADDRGRPACSYKGGDPGFVHVLDDRTIAFPVYDGNGMYLSAGNLAVNPEVGLLFVDLERGHRLRLSGRAALVRDPELVGLWPEAQMAVRVEVREAFPNCPRYVHRYRLVERSHFVPHEGVETPVPDWKQQEWARDVVGSQARPIDSPEESVQDPPGRDNQDKTRRTGDGLPSPD